MNWRLLRIATHVAVCLAVYLLPFALNGGGLRGARLFGNQVHTVSTLLLFAYAYANHLLLVPRLLLARRYALYVLAVLASLLVVVWLPQAMTRRGGPRHPGPRFEGPGGPGFRPGPGGPEPHGGPGGLPVSPLSYNLILFCIGTFASISIRQQRRLLEVQKEKVDAELSFLKAQVNPHFLFNTLNSIYALAITKSDDTPRAITQLSELMRYILKDSDADTVPLEKELAYIANYVALQQRRLRDTARIRYEGPQGPVRGRVAPLILMSFVENAFKHGINPAEDAAIDIRISLEDGRLHFYAANNKVTQANPEGRMGIGLNNAASRLEHFYAGRHRLDITDGPQTFIVNLTLETDD